MNSASSSVSPSRQRVASLADAHAPSQLAPRIERLGETQTEPPQLSARGVTKAYRRGASTVPVLRGVDLNVHRGEFLSIVGQSGCGKSTLLHLLGTLDSPDEGEIYFEENRIDNLTSRGRDILRNRHFGMIFQFYHLLPELTTLENVLSPLMIRQSPWAYWRHRHTNRSRAEQILELVGLSHRLAHKPRELSGGEMQRAAIARALIGRPQLILADEPTGNLDQQTGEQILTTLRRLNREEQLTIIMVTHDQEIAATADRTVRLVEGQVHEARVPKARSLSADSRETSAA